MKRVERLNYSGLIAAGYSPKRAIEILFPRKKEKVCRRKPYDGKGRKYVWDQVPKRRKFIVRLKNKVKAHENQEKNGGNPQANGSEARSRKGNAQAAPDLGRSGKDQLSRLFNQRKRKTGRSL